MLRAIRRRVTLRFIQLRRPVPYPASGNPTDDLRRAIRLEIRGRRVLGIAVRAHARLAQLASRAQRATASETRERISAWCLASARSRAARSEQQPSRSPLSRYPRLFERGLRSGERRPAPGGAALDFLEPLCGHGDARDEMGELRVREVAAYPR